MKILFTGASSFTGFWFVNELTARGHEVTCTLRSDYSGIRKLRADKLADCKRIDARFGSNEFVNLLSKESFDILCHHAARVKGYKNLDFDVGTALMNNTFNLYRVVDAFKKSGGKKIVITGSISERGEGDGTKPLPAIYPYGLSKTLTSETFDYFARRFDIPLQKFVIPNPFGPYEEERFTTYLLKNWKDGRRPEIKTPLYVRDNIPVSLLSKAYASYVENQSAPEKFNPSCYVSTQGEFTKRFASAIRKRLALPCEYTLCTQTEFPEPLERYNTDPLDHEEYSWNEGHFWDELANYYQERVMK